MDMGKDDLKIIHRLPMSNTNNNEKEPKRCVQLVFSFFFFVFFKINYCFIDSNNEMHYREASHKKRAQMM